MRQSLGVLALGGLVLLAPVSMAAFADERADWGVAVSVGADSGTYTLLLENDEGFHLVAVDPFGKIAGFGLGAMDFSHIRPGDRVDYALSTWGGITVADALVVTARRQAQASH